MSWSMDGLQSAAAIRSFWHERGVTGRCGRGRGGDMRETWADSQKYQKGDSASKIAEDLLMSVEEVEEILGKMTVSQ